MWVDFTRSSLRWDFLSFPWHRGSCLAPIASNWQRGKSWKIYSRVYDGSLDALQQTDHDHSPCYSCHFFLTFFDFDPDASLSSDDVFFIASIYPNKNIEVYRQWTNKTERDMHAILTCLIPSCWWFRNPTSQLSLVSYTNYLQALIDLRWCRILAINGI